MSRLVDFDGGETPDGVSECDVKAAFVASGNTTCYEGLERLGQRYGKRIVPILLPEIAMQEINDQTPIWVVKRSDNGRLQVSKSNIKFLKCAIRKQRGGKSSKVGEKGLKFGTSAVECALAKSKDIFPGDADAVVVDADGIIRYIIEYKKHTLPAPLKEHLANRYYYRSDRRKYASLDALRQDVNKAGYGTTPLIVLYFSTRLQPALIRMQSIGRLHQNRLQILEDSEDIEIASMNNQQIGQEIINWLCDRAKLTA